MKVLVTGGAGYIGSVLVGNLLGSGFKVRVLDRFMFGGESLLSYINNKNFEVVKGDIRDNEIVESSLEGIEKVVHLAALVSEKGCDENPPVTLEINRDAVKNLTMRAKNAGVKHFIFISTCSNYGISKEKEATEESTLSPLSLYAETKIASEKFVLSNNSSNFTVTVLRLATIFGLSPKMRFNLMVNELARETALNGKFDIRDKNAWRPFLHAQDASEAIVAILNSQKSKISGQIFNVISENVQKQNLIDLAKELNPNIDIQISETGKDDKRDYRVSAEKIQKTLSWKPKITVREGFKEIYDAVKNGMFLDPYEFRYNAWFDDKVFKEKFSK